MGVGINLLFRIKFLPLLLERIIIGLKESEMQPDEIPEMCGLINAGLLITQPPSVGGMVSSVPEGFN